MIEPSKNPGSSLLWVKRRQIRATFSRSSISPTRRWQGNPKNFHGSATNRCSNRGCPSTSIAKSVAATRWGIIQGPVYYPEIKIFCSPALLKLNKTKNPPQKCEKKNRTCWDVVKMPPTFNTNMGIQIKPQINEYMYFHHKKIRMKKNYYGTTCKLCKLCKLLWDYV